MSEDNPDSQMIAEITEALAANRRIEAIKIYCDAKGARLVEGKEFIDRLMPRLAEEDPEKFGHLTNSKSGCSVSAGAVLFVVLTSMALLLA